MTLRQRFGQALAQARRRRKWSQKQLAAAMRPKASVKWVGEMERGQANTSLDMIERVAVALGWEPLAEGRHESRGTRTLRGQLAIAQQVIRYQCEFYEGLAALVRPLIGSFGEPAPQRVAPARPNGDVVTRRPRRRLRKAAPTATVSSRRRKRGQSRAAPKPRRR